MSTGEGEEGMKDVCGYDETPTCYEKAQWVTNGDALTTLVAWIVEEAE